MIIDLSIVIATFLAAVVGYTFDTKTEDGKFKFGGWVLLSLALGAMLLSGSKAYLSWHSKVEQAEVEAQRASANAAKEAKDQAVALESLAFEASRLHKQVKYLMFIPEYRGKFAELFQLHIDGLQRVYTIHSDEFNSEVKSVVDDVLRNTDLLLTVFSNYEARSVKLPAYLEGLQRSLVDLALIIKAAGKKVEGDESAELRKRLEELFDDWALVATTDPNLMKPPLIRITVINHTGYEVLLERSAICNIYIKHDSGSDELLLRKKVHLKSESSGNENTKQIKVAQGLNHFIGALEQSVAAVEYLRRNDVKQQIAVSGRLAGTDINLSGAKELTIKDEKLSGILRLTFQNFVNPH